MKSKSFRDFHYDHSDIILAVIIFIIAAVIIVWRVNIIMDYPQTLEHHTTSNAVATDDAATAESQAETAVVSGKATWTDDKLAADITVDITGTNAEEIITSLVASGLCTSAKDFDNACKEAKIDRKTVQAGTYTFRKDMTKQDVLKMVTKVSK